MRKLSEYVKEHGVTYQTAFNHYHRGLIKGAYQLENGTIVLPDEKEEQKKEEEYVITYARVSSSENKDNLISQSKRLRDYCSAKGWILREEIKEIGSGINDDRKQLMRIIKEEKATILVIEHKDRLTRFGFNYLKELFKKMNCKIVVINECDSEKEDLMQDFVSIITSFCAKIYGQRRNRRKTEKLIEELKNER